MALDRFFAKVRMPGDFFGCWIWTGWLNEKNYGRFWFDGHLHRAHRIAYEWAFGAPIPAHLQADHLCRTRSCVNPLHIEPVTPQENVARGWSAQLARERSRKRTHCRAGHAYAEHGRIHPKTGRRQCVPCRRALQRRADARFRAKHATASDSTGSRHPADPSSSPAGGTGPVTGAGPVPREETS